MTLDEVIALASKEVAGTHMLTYGEYRKLARWIMDNLAEAQPCGMEPPEAFLFESDKSPGVSFGEDTMSSEDARAVGRGFFAAADEAERRAAAKESR